MKVSVWRERQTERGTERWREREREREREGWRYKESKRHLSETNLMREGLQERRQERDKGSENGHAVYGFVCTIMIMTIFSLK